MLCGLEIIEKGNVLEHMCLALIRKGVDQLANGLVILPTQRLATALSAMLIKYFTVLKPPKMLTLEQFLLSGDAAIPSHPCSELTQELILAGLLKDSQFMHLKSGHEHELNQFFNDLIEFELLELGSSKIIEILEQDAHRDETHITSLVARATEIETLRQNYCKILAERECLTGQQYMAELARNLAAQDICENYSFVAVGCFTTVKEYAKPLLARFSMASNATLYFSRPPSLFAAVNPLRDLIASLGALNEKEIDEEKAGQVRIFHCENIIAEISGAIYLAKKAIAQGVAPSQIAILLTAEAKYSKLLKSLLALEGLESNVATTTSLGQSPLGCFLELLNDILHANLAVEKWQLWLAHPFFCAWMSKVSGCEIPPYDWSSFIHKLSEQSTWEKMREESLVKSPWPDACKLLWEEIESLLGNGRERKLLSVWLNDLGRFQNSLFLNREDNDALTQAFADLLGSFRHSLLFVNPLYSAREFFELLLSKMHASEVRSIGYPLKGIQVLNLVESRYVPFEVAIVLGCIEGYFPKALPKDHLIDNWIKSQIGLPGWQYVEALEDCTFHLLVRHIPNLFLLYPLEQDASPTVRSRYIEKMLVENRSLHDSPLSEDTAPATNPWLTHKNFAQWRTSKGQTQQGATHFFAHTNSTELEYLLHCPYKFLLHRLGLSQEGPKKHQVAKKQGEAIHQILEAFYSGKARGKNLLPPLPQAFSSSEFETAILGRLNFLSSQLFPGWDNSAMAYHLRLFSWPKFTSHLHSLWEKEPRSNSIIAPKRLHEWKFGKDEASQVRFTLQMPDATPFEVALNGSIDIIEIFPDGYIITDYKRKNLPSPRAVLFGHYPQLLLYSIAAGQLLGTKIEEDRTKIADTHRIIGYYSVLEGRWQARAVSASAKNWNKGETLRTQSSPLLEDILVNLQRNWKNRIHDHLNQSRPFVPEKGFGCTFCAYAGLCRESDPKRVEV